MFKERKEASAPWSKKWGSGGHVPPVPRQLPLFRLVSVWGVGETSCTIDPFQPQPLLIYTGCVWLGVTDLEERLYYSLPPALIILGVLIAVVLVLVW